MGIPNHEVVLVERGDLGLVVAALAFLLLDLVQGVSEALLALVASVEGPVHDADGFLGHGDEKMHGLGLAACLAVRRPGER